MPGVRQMLKRAAPLKFAEGGGDPSGSTARTYSTGGRKRATTIGDDLTSLYLIGRMSAPELQEGAEAASASGSGARSSGDVVVDLARAGARGAQQGNMHRDVVSKLGKRNSKTQLYSSDILLWDAAGQRPYWNAAHFMLPHAVLHDEVSSTGDVADWASFGDDAQRRTTFHAWDERVGLTDDHGDVAALGLWGDAATFNTRDSLLIVPFAISCLASTGSASGHAHSRRARYASADASGATRLILCST